MSLVNVSKLAHNGTKCSTDNQLTIHALLTGACKNKNAMGRTYHSPKISVENSQQTRAMSRLFQSDANKTRPLDWGVTTNHKQA